MELADINASGCMLQGMSRKQFEAIQPDTGRMLAASTDGSIFAVALTVQADDEGVCSPCKRAYSLADPPLSRTLSRCANLS